MMWPKFIISVACLTVRAAVVTPGAVVGPPSAVAPGAIEAATSPLDAFVKTTNPLLLMENCTGKLLGELKLLEKYCLWGHGKIRPDPSKVIQIIRGYAQDLVTDSFEETVCTSPLCRSAVLSYFVGAQAHCSPIDKEYQTAEAWMQTVEQCRNIKSRPTETRRYIAEIRFVLKGADIHSDASMQLAQAAVFDEFRDYLGLDAIEEKRLRVVGERAAWIPPTPIGPPPVTLPPPVTTTPPLTTSAAPNPEHRRRSEHRRREPATPAPSMPPPPTPPGTTLVPRPVPGPPIIVPVPTPSCKAPTPTPLCTPTCCNLVQEIPRDSKVVNIHLPQLMIKFGGEMRLNSSTSKDPPVMTLTLLHKPKTCQSTSDAIPDIGEPVTFNLKDVWPGRWASDMLVIPIGAPTIQLVGGGVYNWKINGADFEEAALTGKKRPLCHNYNFTFTVDLQRPHPRKTTLEDDRTLITTWNMPVKGLGQFKVNMLGSDFSTMVDIRSTAACPYEFRVDMCNSPDVHPHADCVNEGGMMKLPCGKTFHVQYFENIAETVSTDARKSRQGFGVVHTRTCQAPTLLPEGVCHGQYCQSVTVTWDTCVKINDVNAKVTICGYVMTDEPQEECWTSTAGSDALTQEFTQTGGCAYNWTFKSTPEAPFFPNQHKLCGGVRVTVDKPAVIRAGDGIVQNALQQAQANLAKDLQCPRFIGCDRMQRCGNRTINPPGGWKPSIARQCWLLWDDDFRAGHGPAGTDAFNLRDDLNAVHVDYVAKADEKKVSSRLKLGFFMPRCIIVPEIKRQIVGEESEDCQKGVGVLCAGTIAPAIFRRYVQLGGVLLYTGGGKQMEGVNMIFGLNLVMGFAGNHMRHPEPAELPEAIKPVAKGLNDDLPILNGMRCLKRGEIDPTAMTPEYGKLKWIYHGEQGNGAGGSAEEAGMGLFHIEYGSGFTTYLAFDFHQPEDQLRRPWADMLKLVLEAQCNKAIDNGVPKGIGAGYGDSTFGAAPTVRRLASSSSDTDISLADTCHEGLPLDEFAQCRVRKVMQPKYRHKFDSSDHGIDWEEGFEGENAPVDGDRVVLEEEFGDWLEESAVETHSIRASERRLAVDSVPYGMGPSNCTFNPAFQADAMVFVVDYRCETSNSDKERYNAEQENKSFCIDYAKKMQDLVEAPTFMDNASKWDTCLDLQLVSHGSPMVLAALSPCPKNRIIDFYISTVNQACNFTLDWDAGHDGNHQGRYTTNFSALQAMMVQSAQGVESFNHDVRMEVCKRPICRRWVDKLYNKFAQCPNSAGVKGKYARMAKALRNVMKSCSKVQAKKNLRNQVLISGLNTINPQELHDMQYDFQYLVGNAIGLTKDGPYISEGVLARDVMVTVQLQPTDSDALATTGSHTNLENYLFQGQMQNAGTWVPKKTTEGETNEWWEDLNDNDVPINFGDAVPNIQMLSITPAIADPVVNPAQPILLQFDEFIELVATKTPAPGAMRPVIQIYPKAFEDICEPCMYCNGKLRQSWYPEETVEPATNIESTQCTNITDELLCNARDTCIFEGGGCTVNLKEIKVQVPTRFICQEIEMDNTEVVTVSGETLQINPAHPLERNVEYVVKFPAGSIKYKSGTGQGLDQRARWQGWPGQASVPYSFSTGYPTASSTKMTIGIGCDPAIEEHGVDQCTWREQVINPLKTLNALMQKCSERVNLWRCNRPIYSPIECLGVTPDHPPYESMAPATCATTGLPIPQPAPAPTDLYAPGNNNGAIRRLDFLEAPSPAVWPVDEALERRLEEVEAGAFDAAGSGEGMLLKMKGIPAQAKNQSPHLNQPPVWPFMAIAIYCACRGLYLAAAWWLDAYVAARFYDKSYKYLQHMGPVYSVLIGLLVPIVTGLIGARVGPTGYWIWVEPNKQSAISQWLRVYSDNEATFNRLWFSSMMSLSCAGAMNCAVALWFLGWSRSFTMGQVTCFIGIIFAGGGVSGGTAGFAYYGQLDLVSLDDLQKCYWAMIYSIAAGASLSKVFCFFIFSSVTYVIFRRRDKIGPVIRYMAWYLVRRDRGHPWRFVVQFDEITLDAKFCRWLAESEEKDEHVERETLHQGALLPGILTLKFYCTTAPFNVCSTRSFPLNLSDVVVDERKDPLDFNNSTEYKPEGFKLKGESLQLDVNEIYDVICIEFYIQDEFRHSMQKIGHTRWDPWCDELLSLYFTNKPICEGKTVGPTGKKEERPWQPPDPWNPDLLKKKGKNEEGQEILVPDVPGCFHHVDLTITKPDDFGDPRLGAIGHVSFDCTHLGPLPYLDERDYPEQAPFRHSYLGTTVVEQALE